MTGQKLKGCYDKTSALSKRLLDLNWKVDCISAMKPSTSTLMQISERVVTCGGIYAVRNHAASDMQADKNGVA